MKISAAVLLVPFLVHAQVNRCVNQEGAVTFTETQCTSAAKVQPAADSAVRVVRSPSPYMLGMAKAAEQSPADRLEHIRLMLARGKLSQARQFARTEEERALVRAMDRGHAPERKPRRPPVRQG